MATAQEVTDVRSDDEDDGAKEEEVYVDMPGLQEESDSDEELDELTEEEEDESEEERPPAKGRSKGKKSGGPPNGKGRPGKSFASGSGGKKGSRGGKRR